ncbi:MAG: hypothetical protein EBZ46_08595 [Actinobacteria bacterium]|nr:hypothetical protein [Actinomycetota bacterium]NCZ55240.1 hypothetical protein [Acidimicrobiia bacterium]NCZ67271.1 hypothetical protein [Acidimicrobiia bacterium]NDA54545.1 hypothetical protein [Actinomycetota bacterium]NDD18407.1 hypothetical protein [Acidimicrobiia bacterium]
MARSSPRSAACTPADSRNRLRQAEAFLRAATAVLDSNDTLDAAGVAAALAVLAGIAASDAACCARLGRRARGQDHREVRRLLTTVHPGGVEMMKHLDALLAAKDDAHYGANVMTAAKATALVGRAARLVALSRAVCAT